MVDPVASVYFSCINRHLERYTHVPIERQRKSDESFTFFDHRDDFIVPIVNQYSDTREHKPSHSYTAYWRSAMA